MKRISALILALLLALTLLGCAPAAEEPSASSPDASPDATAGEDAQPAQDGGLNTDELYTVEVFSMAANWSRPLRRLLGLKRKERAVTTLVLGYSAVNYRRTAQKEKAGVRTI